MISRHVQRVYELRKKAEGQKIWVSLEESTDIEQRHVVCFVIGVIDEERSKSYLANVQTFDNESFNNFCLLPRFFAMHLAAGI